MDLSMPTKDRGGKSRVCAEEPPTLRDSSLEEEESGMEEDEEEGLVHGGVTGRGITISMLMAEGLIEPADNSMSIDYLGRKFTGDLSEAGTILCHVTHEVFQSPSAWAITCKKTVNPAKKSGCGWASVKYKGIRLDAFKSTWYKRQQLQESPFSTSPVQNADPPDLTKEVPTEEPLKYQRMPIINMKAETMDIDGPLNLCVVKPASPSPIPIPQVTIPSVTIPSVTIPSIPITPATTTTTPINATSDKNSMHEEGQIYPVRRTYIHAKLGRRNAEHDPTTLIECTPFSALGKIQPFTISLTSNCLLLMDFHCHLTTSEVVGYMAGKWDPAAQHLSVLQVFPCRCRIGDRENSTVVEEEIRQGVERRGLSLVGWYHSHPYAPPVPSLKDIDAQMDYQLRLKGVGHTYQPCIGAICAPYEPNNRSKESRIDAYWVMPPPENRVNDYGMPMSMHYDSVQDVFLSQDVLNEMQWLIEFYGKLPDKITFKETWRHSLTFLDKIKGSLARKFPKDQTDGRLQDYIQTLLLS